ncbi:MAG: PaaI family thioesterase [Gordonia sp. (in: high G+C Gram-positive bacteria)]
MTSTPTQASDPFQKFAIGRKGDLDEVLMRQKLGTSVTDHRGLIELPALAVLFDDIGGIPFYLLDPTTSSMQARLTMAMVHRPAVDDVLIARGDLQIHDDAFGSTAVTISGRDGTLCVGTARNVRVGRAIREGGGLDGEDAQAIWDVDPEAPNQVPAPAPLDPALSGAEVVAGLIDGSFPMGPISDLLGGGVSGSHEDGSITAHFATKAWMSNMMGTMHGGVIGAMLAQACSFGAQFHVRPGANYQLVDFACEFHRSPSVDGRSVRVEVSPVKLGRRLSLFDARMYDGDVLLGRATADARFDL